MRSTSAQITRIYECEINFGTAIREDQGFDHMDKMAHHLIFEKMLSILTQPP